MAPIFNYDNLSSEEAYDLVEQFNNDGCTATKEASGDKWKVVADCPEPQESGGDVE